MKSWSMTKPVLAVSLALLFSLASHKLHASGPVGRAKQAISSMGGKALSKVTALSAMSVIASFSITALPCNVSARCDTHSPRQVAQTQASSSIIEKDTSLTIPLYDAVQRLKHSQLKELLEAGVIDVNAKDEEGNTALHPPYVYELLMSVFTDGGDLLWSVLEHGADPKIENAAGLSLYYDYGDFFEGVTGGEPEGIPGIVDFMVRLFGINHKGKDGSTALSAALSLADYSGEIDIARGLVASGADVRIPEYFGSAGIDNPLEAAAILVMDKDKFLSLLWEQEEDIVNILTQQGERLLSLAEKWDNEVVVDVLHKYGVRK